MYKIRSIKAEDGIAVIEVEAVESSDETFF